MHRTETKSRDQNYIVHKDETKKKDLECTVHKDKTKTIDPKSIVHKDEKRIGAICIVYKEIKKKSSEMHILKNSKEFMPPICY